MGWDFGGGQPPTLFTRDATAEVIRRAAQGRANHSGLVRCAAVCAELDCAGSAVDEVERYKCAAKERGTASYG